MSNDLHTRIATAAAMRATGKTWDEIAAAVRAQPQDLSRLAQQAAAVVAGRS